MKLLGLLLSLQVIAGTFAIKCHKCSGIIDCSQANIPDVNCNSVSENIASLPDAEMCEISWQVNLDGKYEITQRSCAYGRSNKVDNGPHDCSLNSENGNGQCYCNTDKCNVQPKILESDASRIKCHFCVDGDCLHSDTANFGTEITCPIGVKSCIVTGNKWNDVFYRTCEWKIKDETMDQVGDHKGWCVTTDNPDLMYMCACSSNNCNTGFQGPKCHQYKISNCGGHGTSISGLDENAGPGVTKCLTGTKYCAYSHIDYHDMCEEMYFGCGIGVSSVDEEEMCVEDQNIENVLVNATTCYCDATNKEMCNPSGSTQLQMSFLALSSAFALILRF